jgi:hypothetical protein
MLTLGPWIFSALASSMSCHSAGESSTAVINGLAWVSSQYLSKELTGGLYREIYEGLRVEVVTGWREGVADNRILCSNVRTQKAAGGKLVPPPPLFPPSAHSLSPLPNSPPPPIYFPCLNRTMLVRRDRLKGQSHAT